MRIVVNIENVDKLQKSQSLQKIAAILYWLSFVPHSMQQHGVMSTRQAGTCDSFLRSIQYQQWSNVSGHILFCLGILGAGKMTRFYNNILTSYNINTFTRAISAATSLAANILEPKGSCNDEAYTIGYFCKGWVLRGHWHEPKIDFMH